MDTLSQAVLSHSIVTGEVAAVRTPENTEQESKSQGEEPEPKIIEKDSKPSLSIENFASNMFEKRLVQSIKDQRRDIENSGLCTTCRETKGGQYVDYTSLGHPSTEEILAEIPRDGTIIHVISAQEFPASFIPEIKQYAAGRKIIYVITKCDLAVDEHFKTRQRFLPYVQKELYDKYKINPGSIFAVSTKVGWGVEELFKNLPLDSYIVGLPNTGKTALAFTLGTIYKRKLMGDKVPIENRQRYFGLSYLPLKTKAPIAYVSSGRRITDLPAVQAERGIVYSYISPSKLKTAVDSSVFIRRIGLPATVRQTATKNGSVISLGGMVFIRLDDVHQNSTLVCWCVCGNRKQVVHVFSSLEKAVEVSANPLNSQKEWFLTSPYNIEEASKLGPQEVMKVRIDGAGFDFGVLGYASVVLNIAGKIPEEGIGITIFARPGVEIAPRTPIIPHMRAFHVSKRLERVREMRRLKLEGGIKNFQEQEEHRKFWKDVKNEERKSKNGHVEDFDENDLDFDDESIEFKVTDSKNGKE